MIREAVETAELIVLGACLSVGALGGLAAAGIAASVAVLIRRRP
ncbi:hypothetical protein [Streptomyces himalayensis]|nr:hypothetical protein [Streptomyces himalayensis]